MFRGHTPRTIDTKGRLLLPPDIKAEILRLSPEGKIMLTNFDQCVVGYPLPEWEEIEKSFSSLNMANKLFRDFHRFFLSGAMEVCLDKQGRILVPPYLREYAQLRKDVILAGVGRKFEIWDMERFELKRRSVEENFDLVMDKLAENGFELRF
ncbi:division/cell wall cluster transcriptional repressor MraZ [Desulfonauticus submarinus]